MKKILISIVVVVILVIFGILCALLIRPSSTDDPSFRIIPRSEWKADPPKRNLDSFQTPPFRAVIAHTFFGGCTSSEQWCKMSVKFIQRVHMKNWKDDIGYHFLIGNDGNIYVGCGWDKISQNFDKNFSVYNNNSIIVAFMGDYMTKRPTNKQLEATQWLLQECVENQKLTSDYKLYGERQLIKTDSPGDEIYKIIKKWSHWTNKIV